MIQFLQQYQLYNIFTKSDNRHIGINSNGCMVCMYGKWGLHWFLPMEIHWVIHGHPNGNFDHHIHDEYRMIHRSIVTGEIFDCETIRDLEERLMI